MYRSYYLCQCECGNIKWIRSDSLKNGDTKSCGCLAKATQFKTSNVDYIGKKFGRLTIISATNKKSNTSPIYKCKCECGNIVNCSLNNLKHNTNSCGCLKRELLVEDGKKKVKKILEKFVIEHTNIINISRSKPIRSNKSGVTGVHWDSKRQKWAAQIWFKNEHYNLGRYDTKEEAIKVRKEAEERLFKPFLENLKEKQGE